MDLRYFSLAAGVPTAKTVTRIALSFKLSKLIKIGVPTTNESPPNFSPSFMLPPPPHPPKRVLSKTAFFTIILSIFIILASFSLKDLIDLNEFLFPL